MPKFSAPLKDVEERRSWSVSQSHSSQPHARCTASQFSYTGLFTAVVASKVGLPRNEIPCVCSPVLNLAALRNTLKQASNSSPTRTPVEQKAGDYCAACMDETTVN